MSARLVIGTQDGMRYLDSDTVELAGRSITALSGPWAITDGRGLWRVAPDASPIEMAQFPGRPLATCLLPIDGGVLVGTAEGHLVEIQQEAAITVESFDHAKGREGWHTPWGGPPDVRSMAVGVGAIYVNVHVGGILMSLDNGREWTPTELDIDTDVHQVHAVDHLVLAALGHGGLARSSDKGQSWTISSEGLHASYCRAVAASEGTVLLSASTGPRTQHAALYRGRLASDAFERCDQGLPEWFGTNIDTGCLALDGDEAAFGIGDGRVFVSADRGESWTLAAAGLPPVTAVQFEAA